MLPKNKINEFLEQVVERSHKGKLQWDIDERDQEFENDEEPIGYPSTTTLAPNYLRIAQVRYKIWSDEDRFDWESRIVLDFVDSAGKLLWRFPPNPKIPELYEVVRFESSGIADAVTSFLKSD
jgi:hypothetical protein